MSDTVTYSTALDGLIEGENIAYSFQTPGWYLVLGLLILVGLGLALLRLRSWLRSAYRREALLEVDRIMEGEAGQWSFEINLLLKELAMEFYGPETVAALYGTEWYTFLRSVSKPEERFTDADFERFTDYIYNSQEPDKDLGQKLGNFARHWIRTHHAG